MTDILMWIIIGGAAFLFLLSIFIYNLIKYTNASKDHWDYDDEDAKFFRIFIIKSFYLVN